LAKDVNIHLKTTGAEQTKQQLDNTGRAAKGVGDKTAEGAQKGAAATEQGTKKLGAMGRMLRSLRRQALSFIGAWLGLQAVIKLVNWLIAGLERVQQLQKDIYQRSLQLVEVGQALETQTGTRGQQQFWARQAVALQKAGGLVSPQVAEQMLISMDIAFADMGGIKDKQIRQLAKQLAPFVGAAGGRGLGPAEVGQLFKFAGTAGLPPTPDAYKEYFAKLIAGYTSSESQDIGLFLSGLQKGGTAFLSMGGTLDEAISAYSSALAVTANEALAATLVEQIARLSGGAYQKPRQAIEQGLGVTWADLSMDERMGALLQHVEQLPEAQRIQTLTEQGFPAELTTQIGKMVSPKALRTMEATRQAVLGAQPQTIDSMTDAYLESMLGKERISQADIASKELRAGPGFADWQRRLNAIKKEHAINVAKGTDRWILNKLEPSVIALEQMRDQLDAFSADLPEEYREQAAALRKRISDNIRMIPTFLPSPQAAVEAIAAGKHEEVERLRQISIYGPPPPPLPPPAPTPAPERPVTEPGPQAMHIDNRIQSFTIHNPVAGIDKVDLGIEPPDMSMTA